MDRTGPICALALAAAVASSAACDWDSLDPRLAESGAGGSAAAAGAATAGPGGGGAGGAGGGSGIIPCGGIGLLVDDFESNTVESRWVDLDSSSSVDTDVVGGELLCSIQATSTSDAGVESRYFFDLTDGEISAELKLAPTAGTGRAELIATRNAEHSLRFRVEGGNLHLLRRVNDVESDVAAPIPYSPLAHRWLKLRESAGTISMEASMDGVTFSPLAQVATAALFPLDLVRINISATGVGAMSASQTTWDNVRASSPGKAVNCPARQLTDDFAVPQRSLSWLFASNDSSTAVNQLGGQLVVAFGTNNASAGFDYESSRAHDLRNGFIAIETVARHAAPSLLWMQVTDADDRIELRVVDSTVECELESAGNIVTFCSAPYDAMAHRWIRIRDDAGQAFWESSADGLTWSELGSGTSSIELDGVQLGFGGATPMANPNPGLLILDNFNLLPSP